jgi:hypothetical protein
MPLTNAVRHRIASYTSGEWFHAYDVEEMQAFYWSRLPVIRAAARLVGYAIGVHGSTRRDFDLMAIAWTEEAVSAEELAHAVAMAACGISRSGPYNWEQKPHGRIATSIPICWTEDYETPSVGCMDLSVIQPIRPTGETQ